MWLFECNAYTVLIDYDIKELVDGYSSLKLKYFKQTFYILDFTILWFSNKNPYQICTNSHTAEDMLSTLSCIVNYFTYSYFTKKKPRKHY